MDELNVNRTKMNEKTSGLFRLLDTDQNDLVDALEFLAAAALLSGMATTDKLEFILNAYDFDGSQELSIDEVVYSYFIYSFPRKLEYIKKYLCLICACSPFY
jgi:Ca2+-binding EF-hand superfamily protein